MVLAILTVLHCKPHNPEGLEDMMDLKNPTQCSKTLKLEFWFKSNDFNVILFTMRHINSHSQFILQ